MSKAWTRAVGARKLCKEFLCTGSLAESGQFKQWTNRSNGGAVPLAQMSHRLWLNVWNINLRCYPRMIIPILTGGRVPLRIYYAVHSILTPYIIRGYQLVISQSYSAPISSRLISEIYILYIYIFIYILHYRIVEENKTTCFISTGFFRKWLDLSGGIYIYYIIYCTFKNV